MGDKTILVIDDSSTVLKAVGNMLADYGYQPILVRSMEEALEIDIKKHVNVAVVDLIMPGMDGLEGIKQLRVKDPSLRIIAMSSGDSSHDPYRQLRIARWNGADAMIQKPFDGKMLDHLLKNIDEISGVGCIRVLVVDDSKTVCSAVSKMLNDSRFHVTTANSGKEALGRTDILGIDIVLTDVFMPGESGIEVIQQVRENWPEVQIIAMSGGYGDKMESGKTLEAASKVGANATIPKPFQKEALLQLLNQLMTN